MSWIQENKFVAGLAGTTAVIGGAIIFFGSSQSSEYDEKKEEYDGLKLAYSKLEKSVPYPSKGNLQAKKENVAKYEKVIADVRNTFSGFQAGKIEQMSSQQFSNLRVEMEKKLREAFKGTELPADTAFGFETYTDGTAKPEAAGMLNYQLNAVQALLSDLAEINPSAVNNIVRTPLDVETGKRAAPEKPAPKRPRIGNRRGAAAAPAEKAYTLMPMELSFTATEPGVREFLRSMANSKQYFFAIRALRILNEKDKAPGVNDAKFAAGGGGAAPAGGGGGDDGPGGLFPDFDILPDTGAEGQPDGGAADVPNIPVPDTVKPAAAEGSRILQQVLGAEKLHVFIRFDIVFIKGEAQDGKSTQP